MNNAPRTWSSADEHPTESSRDESPATSAEDELLIRSLATLHQDPDTPIDINARLVAFRAAYAQLGENHAEANRIDALADEAEVAMAASLWSPPATIRVLLVEDLDLLRSALMSLLSSEDDIEVVAVLRCDDTVAQMATRLRPHVVVVDVDQPGVNGLDLVRELRRQVPEAQIVMLAAAKPAGQVQRLLAADVLGAVDKNAPASRLLEAIRGAAKGEPVVDTALAIAALAVEPNPLTPREMEVLQLATEGLSGSEITEQFGLSSSTENALGFVKVMAAVRRDALAVTARRPPPHPTVETYESTDQTHQKTTRHYSVVGAEKSLISSAGASGDSWDLVHAAQQGDTDAFAQLYDRYVDVVYRYVLFRVGDRELAEDVTSETFLRALRRITTVSYQGRDVGAWFVTIARNLVLDHVKSSRFRLEIITAEVNSQKLEPDPDKEAISRATTATLMQCVEQLGDDQRECIMLRFLQGMSVAETATIMNRNEGAVKALQHRAVRRLAQLLPTGLR